MRPACSLLLLSVLTGITNAQDALPLSTAVIEGFAESSDGWSSDEVILDDERREKFLDAVRSRVSDVSEKEINLLLFKLRKAGKLTVKATRRGKAAGSEFLPMAEIAARTIMEKHDVSTDRIMADPKLRGEFDEAVMLVDPQVSLYAVRKAAFQLRKSRRLKPELVLRVADWEKEVQVHPLAEVAANLKMVPTNPGIYLFRDVTGYIYIGEAINLRTRLTKHLSDSDRKGLAKYIESTAGEGLSIEWHSFPKDSPAKQVAVRRAYESELIRSRNPRLNVRP